MSRVAIKDFKTPFLHIMVQGINKEYIFENNKYIEKYLNIIDTINGNGDGSEPSPFPLRPPFQNSYL